MDLIRGIDTSLFLLINQQMSHWVLDAFFVTITNGRFWVVPGIFGALLLLRFQGRRGLTVLILAAVTVSIADPLCCRLLKPFFHRLRPCNPLVLVDGGRFLLGHKGSFSFPSAHAMNMFAQATLWSLLYWRWTAAFVVFAALIGYSRVYVGVHYPLDVAGGAILGAAVGSSVFGVYCVIKRRGKRRVARETMENPGR